MQPYSDPVRALALAVIAQAVEDYKSARTNEYIQEDGTVVCLDGFRKQVGNSGMIKKLSLSLDVTQVRSLSDFVHRPGWMEPWSQLAGIEADAVRERLRKVVE